ncbi:helix-hairpin-helix domain-containing protein [Vibrio sp. JC009]|uniref:ComEA family DNA-binding protein n=1 Tax=Vibrio sp. JC009 TaxID=2912314 RepID=UPI0023B1BC7F|nr:helix-hairpin-helix domain-containing protein [Vibrio sp. JC009]WED22595.1 helix-hairpin-helix domain-containing protein [Vibrio sp. JC009]
MSKFKFIPAALLSAFLAFPAVSADTNSAPAEPAKSAEEKYEGIELKVNINTATADEIATMLKGVGAKKAQEVVKYREEKGLFTSPDDLVNVKGIGQATVDKNRERIEL